MSRTINFGIDLGTTNSVIAKCAEGKVEVFKNPMSLKETLASVVAFRKKRILVGEKAREYMQRDPHNVVGAFKRKMGTAERYHIESIDQDVSPVDLSAQVLKELKNFVHTGENVEAAVITIPASFDTVQSNATKEAGHEAGFKHVTLLQEPIAASLAYVNKNDHDEALQDGRWLVYDLGGGTFDVALVSIDEGEMKVVDHEGDNFLGGTDFDAMIVEKLVIPHLYGEGKFIDLENEMRSAAGKYNRLWYRLQHLAEDAKIQLSSYPSAEIEFEVEDEEEEELDIICTVERGDFENLIAPYIESTIDMIQKILVRNDLDTEDVQFVLMVGGSTYIPYVRNQVATQLGIPVNTNIDPATAVGVGAAYYAATRTYKSSKIDLTKKHEKKESSRVLTVNMAYQKTSTEAEEYMLAKVVGDVSDLFYRITREDGGFDSGLKMLQARVEEDLPLVENAHNIFHFNVYDRQGNILELDIPLIGITQGKFSVSGQPLPNDICIEVDDLENKRTRLEAIFHKNEILPLRRTVTRIVSRTVRKGQDDNIIIQLLEGPAEALPSVNQPIGVISVNGQDLDRDLVKGSDVEITVEISESRDLRITAYLLMTDQEFMDVFTSSERVVNLPKLIMDVEELEKDARQQQVKLEDAEQYDLSQKVQGIAAALRELLDRARGLPDDDVTDIRFQLEDAKRRFAQELSSLTQEQKLTDIKLDFFHAKRYAKHYVDKYGSEAEKKSYEEILAIEKEVLRSNSGPRIEDAANRIWELSFRIRWRAMEFLSWLFTNHYETRKAEYLDQAKADELLTQGRNAIEAEDTYTMQGVINGLYELLPPKKQKAVHRGTGIG